MQPTRRNRPPPDIRYWVRETPQSLAEYCALSPAQLDAARRRMRAHLLAGRRPTPPGATPLLILPLGCLAAGKTTTARLFAAQHHPDRTFVEVDVDDALDFHPLGAAVWRVHDQQSGEVVPGVGHVDAYFECRRQLMDVMSDLVARELLAVDVPRRYDVIMHGHQPDLLQHGARAGFHTVALFVAVPRPLNVRRMRTRAERTGRHWTPEETTAMWERYARAAVWWGLWAHEFWLADNRRELATDGGPVFRQVTVRAPEASPEAWLGRLAEAQEVLNGVLYDSDQRRTPKRPAPAATPIARRLRPRRG